MVICLSKWVHPPIFSRWKFQKYFWVATIYEEIEPTLPQQNMSLASSNRCMLANCSWNEKSWTISLTMTWTFHPSLWESEAIYLKCQPPPANKALRNCGETYCNPLRPDILARLLLTSGAATPRTSNTSSRADLPWKFRQSLCWKTLILRTFFTWMVDFLWDL